jgi:hypothetical protein
MRSHHRVADYHRRFGITPTPEHVLNKIISHWDIPASHFFAQRSPGGWRIITFRAGSSAGKGKFTAGGIQALRVTSTKIRGQ